MLSFIHKTLLMAAYAAFLSLLAPGSMWALTTIDVTTTNDVVDGADGVTSLREAIEEANTGVDSTYVINLVGGETYPLSLGPLMTDRQGLTLTINGNENGLGLATINGTANPIGSQGIFLFTNQSVLDPDPIDIILNDLEITGSGVNEPGTLASAVNLGVRLFHGDKFTINRCYVHNNFARNGAVQPVSVEFVAINDSTLANNTSENVGGAYNGQNTNLEINNSTISGNSAQVGGGLRPAVNTTIRNTTIYNNEADRGGGIFFFPNTDFDIQNSIVSGNTATVTGDNCAFDGAGVAPIFSSGHNVFGDLEANCSPTSNTTGDQNGVNDPMLGALADNGGLTPTHAVLAGSAALENGDPNGCNDTNGAALLYDQRGFGFPRVEDGDSDGTDTCDSGAYERTNPVTQIGDGIMALMDDIAALPADAFGNGNKQNATLNKLDAIEGQFAAILAEEDPAVKAQLIADLSNKLIHDLLAKGNGCEPEPDNNDWIVDCEAQATYQAAIEELLELLATL